MGKKLEKIESCELMVAIRPQTGQLADKITAEMLRDSLHGDYLVREVEGNSVEMETLAQTCREVLKTHVIQPMTKIVQDQAQTMITAWDDVKARVEPLLQGRHSQCPACGTHALTPMVSDGDDFICPDCQTPLKWKKILNDKHPDQGYTVLVAK